MLNFQQNFLRHLPELPVHLNLLNHPVHLNLLSLPCLLGHPGLLSLPDLLGHPDLLCLLGQEYLVSRLSRFLTFQLSAAPSLKGKACLRLILFISNTGQSIPSK